MTERFHFLRYFRFFGRSWQNIASKAAAPTAPSHSSGIRICPTKSRFPISAQTAVHPLATAAHCTFRSFAIQPQITPDATAPSSAAQRPAVISREYSAEWKKGDEPYYPVNDEKNGALYAQYKKLADAEPGVIFGGRLGEYKYYDMDKVIEVALSVAEKELA